MHFKENISFDDSGKKKYFLKKKSLFSGIKKFERSYQKMSFTVIQLCTLTIVCFKS